jgi:hypothetical protein
MAIKDNTFFVNKKSVEKNNCSKKGKNHYFVYIRDYEGLKDIVENNRLRVGNIKQFNDVNEGVTGKEYLLEWCKELLPEFSDKITGLLEKQEQRFNQIMSNLYVLCTTKLKDDAGMWNSYGDNGKGYCLEIVGGSGNKSKRKENDTAVSIFQQVIYNKEEVDKKFYTLFDNDKVEQIFNIPFRVKHDCWKSEEECRKYFILGNDDMNKINIETTGSEIKNYIYVTFETGESNQSMSVVNKDYENRSDATKIIKSVRLGPRIKVENKEIVEMLLKDNGFKVNKNTVKLSELRFK